MVREVQPDKGKGVTGSSLQTQVALVIALLSLLPNLVMALLLLLPSVRGGGAPVPWLPLLLWLGVVVILSVVIGYYLSRQLLLPLSRLSGQLATLGHLGAGRVRVDPAPTDPAEVATLKQSFNALLAQVALEQRHRDSFMAALTHDLKTPLIAANHLLTVIRDDDALSREERIGLVSQLQRENDSLIALVQKLVDAHKVEQGLPLQRQSVALETLVEGVARRVGPLARERGVAIEVRGSARASVDARELERALYNLVSNAVRYAHKLIRVEIFAGVIRLADDGPGLPAPLEELAQPFNAQPLEIAGKHYSAGSGGLGLYIARRLIEAHGGRLVSEASGPKGTVLLIYLGQASG
jgi:signal transduction histidine kinase